MKIALVYNRDSRNVINLFGVPNRERIGMKSIRRIKEALKAGGHQVIAVEGDKELIKRLEEFMPRVVKGERPGMALNISYGIQGQARYTHVPGILEMVGIPYVGSGPLAHSLALDKVVAKMLFRQNGLPTPDFAVVDRPDTPVPALRFPVIVKPKNEALSMGLTVVRRPEDLPAAIEAVAGEYQQAALVEEYIEGREINVGLLGNGDPEAFPVVELIFGEGERVYTREDKLKTSGREIRLHCPAELAPELTARAQELAKGAFKALGCFDCARVDMRIDSDGEIYILEVNSLPSLGVSGSYPRGALELGLDFHALINRLIETASARYFGTPAPARPTPGRSRPDEVIIAQITRQRDQIEKRVKQWTSLSSRTHDPIGIRQGFKELDRIFHDLGMRRRQNGNDDPMSRLWTTEAGGARGTLLIGRLDIPIRFDSPRINFRRDPELLFGEGIALSRGPLVMLEYALRALRSRGALKRLPLGVLICADEGDAWSYSSAAIRQAASESNQVLSLRPGTIDGRVIIGRRGLRRYRLLIEGESRRLGAASKKGDPVSWAAEKINQISALSNRRRRITVAVTQMNVDAYPAMMPHAVTMDVSVSYPAILTIEEVEGEIRRVLECQDYHWALETLRDHPPMIRREANKRLADQLAGIAADWDIPLSHDTSVLPSVAGLIPAATPVLCGIGPAGGQLYTPEEHIHRISLIQRTILLTLFLLALGETDEAHT